MEKNQQSNSLEGSKNTVKNFGNKSTEDECMDIRKSLFHEHADAEFIFPGGKKISCNKSVLCWRSRSPVFYQIFFGPLKENTIEIKDFDCNTFQLFLNWVMGFDKITKANAAEIFPITCKYLATKWIEKCATILKPVTMNEDVCTLLNWGFVYNQPILCKVVKEYIIKEGSPYELLENEKLSFYLSPDSFLEVLTWVTMDSCVLNAIVCWCDNFRKINKRSDSIKELLDELGLTKHFKVNYFETGFLLSDFVDSKSGKDIFTTSEICKYFTDPKHSADNKSKWIKMYKGESFSEEYESSDFFKNTYDSYVSYDSYDSYKKFLKIGKIVTYTSPEINISCTVTLKRPNRPDLDTALQGKWIPLGKKFNIPVEDGHYGQKFEVKYTFKQDCRIYVTNKKPIPFFKKYDGDKKVCSPYLTHEFYFTDSIIYS